MATIEFTSSKLSALKYTLRKDFPGVSSSHLTEALASALGYRTNAALLASMPKVEEDPPFVLLDTTQFLARLKDFGYPDDPEFDFELLESHGVISTVPLSAYDIEYKSLRQKAWRNLMVCTVNAALEQKLISLRPGDNRWPGASSDPRQRDDGCLFDYTLPNGLPVRGYIGNAGFDELTVHAAVNPKGDWVRAGNAGFYAGDTFSVAWLERKTGAWLQSSTTLFQCRRHLLQVLADIQVKPMGFGDRGHTIM